MSEVRSRVTSETQDGKSEHSTFKLQGHLPAHLRPIVEMRMKQLGVNRSQLVRHLLEKDAGLVQ